MFTFMIPIRYVEPVFRPPSEADSLILPVTDGCSWNQCTYCEMYTSPQKKFRPRDEAETIESIRRSGAESGDDLVLEKLEKVNKGETFASTCDALNKLQEAGIKRSVMLLNGLGGTTLSRQHAENSAKLANATQPDYLATHACMGTWTVIEENQEKYEFTQNFDHIHLALVFDHSGLYRYFAQPV